MFITFLFCLVIVRLRKVLKEKTIKNEQLKYLFTEINPTPIIRTDKNGIIVYCNEVAKRESPNIKLLASTIVTILPNLDCSKIPNITNVSICIKQKYYSIEVRYIDFINGRQFYFYDVTEQVHSKRKSNTIIKANISKLTTKEKQVFALVSKGLTSEEIAKQLKCCKRTVTTHRHAINKKLKSHPNYLQIERIIV